MPIDALVPLVLAGAVSASVPTTPPQTGDAVVDALVAEALAYNPDLRAAEQAARAARERPVQASALADPVLAVGYTNEGWSPSLGTMPDTTLAFVVSQDLPYPGKRRLRGQIASLDADTAGEQLARGRLGVAAAVRRAYAGLQLARALTELTREQADVWRQIEGVARARYAVGQGSQQDVLRTQVELTRVGQTTREQEAEASIRLAEINRLVGRAPATALEAVAPLVPAPPAASLAEEAARLQAQSPELRAAQAAVERARLSLALAQKEYRPDFAVLGGYMNRGGLDPMWQVGFSVSLPFNRKRRAGGVAEAEALHDAARARSDAAGLQLRLRTEERIAQLQAARDVATLYSEGIVVQDRMSVEAAIASYQAGRIPFIAVLESLMTMYGDRATLVRLLASQWRIRASLDEGSLESTPETMPAPSPALAGGVPDAATASAPRPAMGSMR